jgi:hypothetical protein
MRMFILDIIAKLFVNAAHTIRGGGPGPWEWPVDEPSCHDSEDCTRCWARKRLGIPEESAF